MTDNELPGQNPLRTVAEVLHVSPRRVQQLAAAGIIPRAERGRYRLDECITGYVRHLQGIVDDADRGKTSDARVRLLRERARGLRLHNRQRAAAVIPLAHAEAVLEETQAIMSEEAERLCADELADELAAADRPALIRARLQEAVRDMRQRVAGYLGELAARGRQ